MEPEQTAGLSYFRQCLPRIHQSNDLDLIHTAGPQLEAYVKKCIEAGHIFPVDAEFGPEYLFSEWARKNVKRFLVSEGHCYSEKLWTGGISALLFEDKKERLGIMDFKPSKEAYLSQFFQIAGYDIAISQNGILDENGTLIYKPDRSIGFCAVFPFGMEKPAPQFHYDTEGAKRGFEAASVLHKLISNN